MNRQSKPYRAIPLEEWPAHDQVAWGAARRREDLLDPDGRAAGWTRKSVRCSLLAYGLWLDHLGRTDRLDPAATAGSRVSAETSGSFISELQQRVTPLTLAGYVARLASMIAALDPAVDRTLLARAQQRLAA